MVYFRCSISHALYRLACKPLPLSVLVSPLREQSPSIRVRYGVITGPSLSRAVPSTMTPSSHGLSRVRQAGRSGPSGPGSTCANTLNSLRGHPQQSSLRPFPHKRGSKLWRPWVVALLLPKQFLAKKVDNGARSRHESVGPPEAKFHPGVFHFEKLPITVATVSASLSPSAY
jgi:hypothetical protein